MSKEYFVSHQGVQRGPFQISHIIEELKQGSMSPLDYIFDDSKNDWVLMLEFSELAAHLANAKPKAPPKPGKPEPRALDGDEEKLARARSSLDRKGDRNAHKEHLITEWYVLKGENKFGPFAFTDVIKMLQQKVVFEFDFVWHPGMSAWKRVAEMPAFASANIKDLKSTLMPEIEEIFFRRRYRRMSYNGTILVHDNKTVWKGQGVEISAGGAGVVMENATLVPGQSLFLHFKPCDGVPPFNAHCEVVSKKFVEGVKEKSTPIRYGLKFTSVSANTQKMLEEISTRTEAA